MKYKYFHIKICYEARSSCPATCTSSRGLSTTQSVSGSIKVPPFLTPLPHFFSESIFASFLHTSLKVSRSPLHSKPHCGRLPARKHASAGRRRPLINGRRCWLCVHTQQRAQRPVPQGDYAAAHGGNSHTKK